MMEAGRPTYLDPNCPTHGTPLIPFRPKLPSGLEQPWEDAWECPQCPDSIWMDWSPEQEERASCPVCK